MSPSLLRDHKAKRYHLAAALLAGDQRTTDVYLCAADEGDPAALAVLAIRRVNEFLHDASKKEPALAAMKAADAHLPEDNELLALLYSAGLQLSLECNRHDDAQRTAAALEGVLVQVKDAELRARVTLESLEKYAYQMGGPARSLELLTAARERMPHKKSKSWGEWQRLLASRHVEMGAFSHAEECLDQHDRLGQPDAGALARSQLLRAIIYSNTNRLEDGLALLNRLAKAPAINQSALMSRRVWMLTKARRFAEAESALAEYRGVFGGIPDYTTIIQNLEAGLALSQGQLTKARDLALRGLKHSGQSHPGQPLALCAVWALGILLQVELLDRQAPPARRILQAVDPRQTDINYALAWARVYLLEGDWDNAARFLAIAESRGPLLLEKELEQAREMSAGDFIRLHNRAAALKEKPPVTISVGRTQPPGKQPAVSQSAVFIGESASARQVREWTHQVALVDSAVLIGGETGTGKEVVARMLHEQSPRAALPFIPINCGALSDTLVESELFGHAKGAFTGATEARRGLFETAGEGTIFLDEVQAMSPRLQASLLRVLENREIRPVGGTHVRQTKARVIAASNEKLQVRAAAGEFRSDLFYRLARLRIEIPPLRERPEDIETLARHFVRGIFGDFEVTIGDDLMEALRSHPWPGNVRELKNEMERIAMLAGGARVLTRDMFRGEAESLRPGEKASRRREARASAAEPGQSLVSHGASVRNPYNQNVRRQMIQQLFEAHESLTRLQVINLLGCAPDTASRDLASLVSQGVIKRVDTSAHARTCYFVRASREAR